MFKKDDGKQAVKPDAGSRAPDSRNWGAKSTTGRHRPARLSSTSFRRGRLHSQPRTGSEQEEQANV